MYKTVHLFYILFLVLWGHTQQFSGVLPASYSIITPGRVSLKKTRMFSLVLFDLIFLSGPHVQFSGLTPCLCSGIIATGGQGTIQGAGSQMWVRHVEGKCLTYISLLQPQVEPFISLPSFCF